jgi:SAM-dependent methyltransferase
MRGLTDTIGHPAAACRMCGGSALARYLDLGHMPPADQFLRPDQLAGPTVHYPLEVCLCLDCGLSQLGYVVSPKTLYQDEYPYEASVTRAGKTHFRQFAADVVSRFGFDERCLAVDVGSNVGVLLSGFAAEGMRVLGIDPAENIVEIANSDGIPTIAAMFSLDVARGVAEEHGRASVITATNVFAHVDDLNEFMRAVDELLADDGVLVIEAPWIANLLLNLEYDTIYHEHLSYIAIKPLQRFFERLGMRLFDAREVDIHGGSIRIFVDRGRRPVENATLDDLLRRETDAGAFDLDRLHRFAEQVAANRIELQALLHDLRRDGKRIVAVSAPAKGMTLLNYCRLGPETLEYVTEKSRLKIGRFTPGMHLPVVGDDELLRSPPDYALLLAWNFADEIIENLREFAEAGGRFIVPIPSPRIVAAEEKEAARP